MDTAPFPNLRCHTPPLSPPGRGDHGNSWKSWGSIGKKMGLFRQLFSKWNRISYQIRKLPLSTLKLSNFGKKSVGGRSKSLYLQRHTALHLHQQNNPSPLLEMLDTSNDFPNLWAVAVRIIGRHSPWPQQHTKHRQRHLSAPILHTKGGVLHPESHPMSL